MEKVYIIEGRTTTYDDVYGGVAGVHTTEEGAKKALREEIDSLCENINSDLYDKFNDEDYAEDFEGYETFGEYWDDWVNEHFIAEDFWRYSDESDYTYEVSIIEKYLVD